MSGSVARSLGNLADTLGTTATANVSIDAGTLFVDATNDRVGIGTNSPSYKLTSVGGAVQLSGGTTAQEGIRIQRASGYAGIYGINNDNNAYNAIACFTSASEAMRIDTSGNVGIGTSSPGVKLDITGSLRASQSITIGNGGGTYQAGSIYSDGNWGMIFRSAQTSPAQAEFRWSNSGDTALMVIDSAANVRMGDGISANGTGRYFDIYNLGANSSTFAITRLITQAVASSSSVSVDIIKYKNGLFSINNNDTNAAVATAFGIGGTERLRIDSSGRVLKPNQIAFNAAIPYTTTTSLWPNNSSNFINYSSVHLNRGSHFNATNGRFTAPVAGAYYFIGQLSCERGGNDLGDYVIAINDAPSENYSPPVVLSPSTGAWVNGTISVVLNLAVNDYVTVRRLCCNDLKPSSFRMIFAGFLIG